MEGQSNDLYGDLTSGKTARYDEKLVHLLTCAARVFADKGYEKASMRQVAQEAGFSLAGLYHYVRSKEELLFFIQYHTFGVLAAALERTVQRDSTPEDHLQLMVRNHVRYLAEHLPELKVCTTELESLHGDFYQQVLSRRQRYFELTREILTKIGEQHGSVKTKTGEATLYLFGMINWIVMWFDSKRNDPVELADNLTLLFLNGFRRPMR